MDTVLFFNYLEQVHSLDRILQRLSSNKPVVYLLKGELKSGKTTILRHLETRMRERLSEFVPGDLDSTDMLVFPVYVSCQQPTPQLTYLMFARQVVQEFIRSWEWKTGIDDAADLLRRDDSEFLDQYAVFAALADNLHRLGTQLSESYAVPFRIVLLIDDADTMLDQNWCTEFATSLKTFIEQASWNSLRAEALGMILAGTHRLTERCPKLAQIVQFAVLLHPLTYPQVIQVLEQTIGALPPEQTREIFLQTGGHPWLLGFILKFYVENARQKLEVFQRYLPDAAGRFQEDNADAFLRLRKCLPDKAIGVLLRLCLEMHDLDGNVPGIPFSMTGGLSLAVVNTLAELGLVAQWQDEQNTMRVAVTRLTAGWIRDQFGAAALTSPTAQSEKTPVFAPRPRPFTMLLSLRHRIIISSGFRTIIESLDMDFQKEELLWLEGSDILDYPKPTRRENREWRVRFWGSDLRKRLAARAPKFLAQLQEYIDFVRQQSVDARFIFQIDASLENDDDRALIDYPIELLLLDERGILSLQFPVCKQLLGIAVTGGSSYFLDDELFAGAQSLNVLLIASGAEGDLDTDDGQHYNALSSTYTEINDILEHLLQPGARLSGHAIGHITCLTDNPERIQGRNDARVVVHPLSFQAMDETLNGQLSNTKYHWLHFAGHYHVDERAGASGLVIPSDEPNFVSVYSQDSLNEALRDNKSLHIAFFSACRSGSRDFSTRGLMVGLSQVCLVNAVRLVIGMRWPIRDEEATLISRRFYDHLTEPSIVKPDVAMQLTCRDIYAERNTRESREQIGDDSVCWAAPVIFTS